MKGGFDWQRMGNTPEGRLSKKQGSARDGLDINSLAETYERQAVTDLEGHLEFAELLKDIHNRLSELLQGSEDKKMSVAEELAKKHEKTLRNHKGLEEAREQVAYVFALAFAVQDRRRKQN